MSVADNKAAWSALDIEIASEKRRATLVFKLKASPTCCGEK